MAKPQSKTEKKIDNNVRLALTSACEQFLEDVPGFQWLTHQANYTNFPATLLITCVFDTQENQEQVDVSAIHKLLQSKMLKIGVKLKAPKQQVVFDSEEACDREHSGDWVQRLASRELRSVAKNRPESSFCLTYRVTN
mgnify:CR=1 FL=1